VDPPPEGTVYIETQQLVHEWRLMEKSGHEESLDLDPFMTKILDSEHGHVIS
jgi:hypothetical protein